MIEPDWFHPREECGDCGSTRADAQALADVRTLDEWVEMRPGSAPFQTCPAPVGDWVCYRQPVDVPIDVFHGDNAEAARAAAAAWVRGQDTKPAAAVAEAAEAEAILVLLGLLPMPAPGDGRSLFKNAHGPDHQEGRHRDRKKHARQKLDRNT